jgi:hypothetical protein
MKRVWQIFVTSVAIFSLFAAVPDLCASTHSTDHSCCASQAELTTSCCRSDTAPKPAVPTSVSVRPLSGELTALQVAQHWIDTFQPVSVWSYSSVEPPGQQPATILRT